MKANNIVCFHSAADYCRQMTTRYDLIPFQTLMPLMMQAADRLARLDERVSRSPVGQGLLQRLDFQDAAASLWNDGELVHIEDLVLHDAHMDIRTPTQEITDAHRIMRARRHIGANKADWALSAEGLSLLLSARRGKANHVPPSAARSEADIAEPDDLDEIDRAFQDIDALLARSANVLDSVREQRPSDRSDPLALFHDPDWDEDERLDQWLTLMEAQNHLPGILQAVVALDAWEQIEVSQKSPWLGRLLAASVLRRSAVTVAHLPCFNIGLKNQPRRQRQGLPLARRLSLFLHALIASADYGLAEHDKLMQAKARMERITKGRRSNSRLPDLIELALAKPVVSTSMIVEALGTTPQGAVGLANQLEIRELTGRGRFRAWGIV